MTTRSTPSSIRFCSFWDGNEVYLVTASATLYLAFPRLFPAFVSGFYLPEMIVLWLLALRGVAIEMRHKLDHPMWNELWDGGFFLLERAPRPLLRRRDRQHRPRRVGRRKR